MFSQKFHSPRCLCIFLFSPMKAIERLQKECKVWLRSFFVLLLLRKHLSLETALGSQTAWYFSCSRQSPRTIRGLGQPWTWQAESIDAVDAQEHQEQSEEVHVEIEIL